MRSNERKTLPSPAARTGHSQNLVARKGSAIRHPEDILVRKGWTTPPGVPGMSPRRCLRDGLRQQGESGQGLGPMGLIYSESVDHSNEEGTHLSQAKDGAPGYPLCESCHVLANKFCDTVRHK